MSDIGSSDEANSHPPNSHQENEQRKDINPENLLDKIELSTPQTSYVKSNVPDCEDLIDLKNNNIENELDLITTDVGVPIVRRLSATKENEQDIGETRAIKSTSDSITPGTTPVESNLKRLKPIDDEDVISAMNLSPSVGKEEAESAGFIKNTKDSTSDYTDISEKQQNNQLVDNKASTSNEAEGASETADNIDVDRESDYLTIGSSDDEDDLSDVSSLSGLNWKPKPVTGLNNWVHRRMCDGSSPREILNHMLPNSRIPDQLEDVSVWQIIFNLLNEPPCRKKLKIYNTIDDAVKLIKNSKDIIVLTGAGVSTSSGIPDFRSKDGIYARLHVDFPDLPDPHAMFDISYFRKDPRPFFKFSKEIYPGQFQPAIGHRLIRCLEKHGCLLRNYTQNIDTLEQVAGINRVINCHGSFATATCTNCRYHVDASVIKDDIFEQRIPKCPRCPADTEESAVMKPDIVFFGEGLPDTFHDSIGRDKNKCDLLIVIGSSMKVRPVALIPSSIPDNIPQILINREPLGHLVFDIELLGDCDDIIQEICLRLGEDWAEICEPNAERLTELTELPIKEQVDFNITSRDDTQAMETSDHDENKGEAGPSTFFDENLLQNRNQSEVSADQALGHQNTIYDVDTAEKTCAGLIDSETSTVNDNNNDAILLNEKTNDGFGSTVAEPANPATSSVDEYADVASQLPPSTYLYVAPSRYIFKGAEVNNQMLEKYRRKHNQVDEAIQEDEHQPTVSKHLAHIASSLSTFSSVTSSAANSSSDSSSYPDCSSIDRSPINNSGNHLIFTTKPPEQQRIIIRRVE